MLDERNFVSLVPPQTPGMLRVAAALVGRADAEDATQEAILQAWRSWSTLRSIEALRPWLLRITVNVCRQWYRGSYGREQRRTQGLPDEGGPPLALLQLDAGSSEHTTALDVRHTINRLESDLRVVVVLRYYGEMDATEIGDTLGIPATTVRTRLRRALAILRQNLAAGDEPVANHIPKGGSHV